jgi:hypothetical protein
MILFILTPWQCTHPSWDLINEYFDTLWLHELGIKP